MQFNLDSKMNAIEQLFPEVRIILHRHFHIGGCQKCGYEEFDTIADVARKYQKDPTAVLEVITQGLNEIKDAEITIENFAQLQRSGEKLLLIDVRTDWEYNVAHISNSILLNQNNADDLFKQAQAFEHVIIICHHGMRSMQATLNMRANGLSQAKSLKGGIDAYSRIIDPSIQRY